MPSPLASLVSGLAPVKNAVDQITSAAKQLSQLGIPADLCGQLIALATSALPIAAQGALGPGGGMQLPAPPSGPGPNIQGGM